MRAGRDRKPDILDAAAEVFASAGTSASIHKIAAESGLRVGSLYHHFDSKDDIVRALVGRLVGELDELAERSTSAPSSTGPIERLISLSGEIGLVADRHRAALLTSMYGSNRPAGDTGPGKPTPPSLERAVLALLLEIRRSGELRSQIDAPLLADLMCQSTLHVGLGLFADSRWVREIAMARCRILLDGVATRPHTTVALDRSAAAIAASKATETWNATEDVGDERSRMLRAVAAREFARRGYAATTMRDVAAAAGLRTTSTIFRRFPTKDSLISSITESFTTKVQLAWTDVLSAPSPPLERLDALISVDLQLLDRFGDELSALQAWLRESPPSSRSPSWGYPARLRDLDRLVRDGHRNGDIQIDAPRSTIRARALADFIWLPENILRANRGHRGALLFARDTVIRGALEG